MDISDKLTQQKFLEILIMSYSKGQENIKLVDLIEEIKKEVLSISHSN
jgi:hypothetical protein